MAVIARPLDNPRLHDLLERIRTRTGNTVIYRQGAVRKVLRELAANRGVAILIDQHLHSADAVYVDFFGRPAATTTALAALALRTGARGDSRRPRCRCAGRSLHVRVRARRRAAAWRWPGGDSGVHAAVHRRAGGVHPATSRAVAVDAPAVAGRALERGRE